MIFGFPQGSKARRLAAIVIVLGGLVFWVVLNLALPVESAEGSREPAAVPSDFTQQARLVSGKSDDNYANIGVGISGSTAVVSSADGVYVYVRSGSTWSQQALLVPSGGLAGFGFPGAIAIEDDTVVMGCSGATINGNTNQGAAYVFVRSGNSWSEQQRLTASDGDAGSRFGRTIAFSGQTIIVGAPTAAVGGATEQGAAYVFVRNGTSWSEQAKLLATDGGAFNNFGHLVAISADTAVVTRNRRINATIVDPAAYVFVRNGTTWSQQQKLSVCEPSGIGGTQCAFGSSISIAGDTLAVGNWFLTVGGNSAQGGVYIFSRSGTSWTQQQKLTAADGHENSLYGSAVGLSSQKLVVGAEADIGFPGAAYVYNWTGSEWSQPQKLEVGTNRNLFGQSLSMSGNTLLISSPADIGFATPNLIGAAYVFTSADSAPALIQLSSATQSIGEAGGHLDVGVNRSGDLSGAATVDYKTSDIAGLNNCNVFNGIASSRCDYATSVGTVHFDPGQTSKNISIPIVDDSFAEGSENFTITLSNATGATLGAPNTATVTISDNDTADGPNPIDQTPFFVRQHYIDFLNREPDPPGFAGWQAIINNCPPGDITCDRIHVSSAFFRSPEFQERGYFVYRFYSVSFGRKPDYVEFTPDIAKVSGFLSDSELEAAKVAFINDFMARPAFANFYNPLNNTQYVDTLLTRAGITHVARDFWIAALTNGTRTRAQVLREIAESTEVYNKYFNQAFVVMQYFGYLRRDPDALYVDWIAVLDSSGDYRGMVNGFMNSLEYRFRFGP